MNKAMIITKGTMEFTTQQPMMILNLAEKRFLCVVFPDSEISDDKNRYENLRSVRLKPKIDLLYDYRTLFFLLLSMIFRPFSLRNVKAQ